MPSPQLSQDVLRGLQVAELYCRQVAHPLADVKLRQEAEKKASQRSSEHPIRDQLLSGSGSSTAGFYETIMPCCLAFFSPFRPVLVVVVRRRLAPSVSGWPPLPADFGRHIAMATALETILDLFYVRETHVAGASCVPTRGRC